MNKSALAVLTGRRVTGITFVLDYHQLIFDSGYSLTALADPELFWRRDVWTIADPGYRDTLCAQVGKRVESVLEETDSLEVRLEAEVRIVVRLDTLSSNPERALLFGPNGFWNVWQGTRYVPREYPPYVLEEQDRPGRRTQPEPSLGLLNGSKLVAVGLVESAVELQLEAVHLSMFFFADVLLADGPTKGTLKRGMPGYPDALYRQIETRVVSVSETKDQILLVFDDSFRATVALSNGAHASLDFGKGRRLSW